MKILLSKKKTHSNFAMCNSERLYRCAFHLLDHSSASPGAFDWGMYNRFDKWDSVHLVVPAQATRSWLWSKWLRELSRCADAMELQIVIEMEISLMEIIYWQINRFALGVYLSHVRSLGPFCGFSMTNFFSSLSTPATRCCGKNQFNWHFDDNNEQLFCDFDFVDGNILKTDFFFFYYFGDSLKRRNV
jgi:hypothetical protein